MSVIPFSPPLYPIGSFLVVVREAGLEIQRNVQAPDALIGMSLISAMTMACQGQIDVRMPTGQVRPVTQNVLIICQSGDRKSSVDALVFAPFRAKDAQAAISHKAQIAAYPDELEWWRAKSNRLRRAVDKAGTKGRPTEELKEEVAEHTKSKPALPRLRIMMRHDITARAIMDALEGDGESLAITTDEGQTLFKGGAMSNLGLLNRLWDSPSILTVDRADMDHVLVMNPRVSISIMTQPAVLREYLDKRGSIAKGSGHWARYLVGSPVSTQGYRWVAPYEAPWHQLPAFHERIKELIAEYEAARASGTVTRQIIEFSDDAKSRWYDLAGQTEWMLRPGDYLHDINDFASKVMEILARLAAVMHHFSGETGKVSLDCVFRSCRYPIPAMLGT